MNERGHGTESWRELMKREGIFIVVVPDVSVSPYPSKYTVRLPHEKDPSTNWCQTESVLDPKVKGSLDQQSK